MKRIIGAAAVASLLLFAAQAQGEKHRARPHQSEHPRDSGDWTRPLGDPSVRPAAAAEISDQTEVVAPGEIEPAPEVDVVDAHWMALTMWGEARSHGEAGLRAVGHVIHNRWQANGRYGDFVTDTVSQAFQFSCWNPGDPNRAAMLNVDTLPKDSHDYRMWVTAKQVAQEILAGRSEDPTGGALFYHTTAVSPRWSAGVAPVRRIGNHLFFLTAR